MSRIEQTFTRLANQGKSALIPYITCGDPSVEVTLSLMKAMVASGADLLEIGIPFSDPMADGPVIQKAHERALESGDVGLSDVLEVVRAFREEDVVTPIVLMGYLNTVEVKGYQQAAEACEASGVDGVLMVDLPPEEHDLMKPFNDLGIATIYLVSPTTTDERLQKICSVAGGYLYYVSLKGVTGADALDVGSVNQRLGEMRQFTSLPIAVGFGINNPENAARVGEIAEGVIVGSALVKEIEANLLSPDAIESKILSILSGMKERMNA